MTKRGKRLLYALAGHIIFIAHSLYVSKRVFHRWRELKSIPLYHICPKRFALGLWHIDDFDHVTACIKVVDKWFFNIMQEQYNQRITQIEVFFVRQLIEPSRLLKQLKVVRHNPHRLAQMLGIAAFPRMMRIARAGRPIDTRPMIAVVHEVIDCLAIGAVHLVEPTIQCPFRFIGF